jgi:hypothetical protein
MTYWRNRSIEKKPSTSSALHPVVASVWIEHRGSATNTQTARFQSGKGRASPDCVIHAFAAPCWERSGRFGWVYALRDGFLIPDLMA